MIQGVKVLDVHNHFPVAGGGLESWFPGYSLNKRVSFDLKGIQNPQEVWRKAFNFESGNVEFQSDEVAAERWFQDINEKGIEKVVFVSGGGDERLSKIISRHPDRFIGFAHVYPFEENAAEKLEKAITEYGMKGYKLLAPAFNIPLNDKSLYPLWEVCKAYDIPVLSHFGILGAGGGVPTGVNISPMILEQIALDFPTVNFIVPHFGAGYPTELLHLCWTRPNVFVDSSGSNQWVRWMAYDLTLTDLFRKFYQTIGPERILFASDSSSFPRGYSYTYLEEQHKIMRFLGFPERDIEKILYKNSAALLKVE